MLGWLSASGWLLAVCCWLAGWLAACLAGCIIGGRFYRIGGCLDHLSVSLLDPRATLGTSGGPSDHMASAFVVRGWFSSDFEGLLWRSGAPFSHSNEDLDVAIATYGSKMFLGLGLDDFLVILGCPRTWKTMKFMQLSFKIKVRQNGIGNTSWRSLGSIF